MRKISVLNLITFLAAFLLFQLELIISKILLPDFGGSYLVWGSCVVFFQAVLFLGYLYSYIVLKKIGIKRYRPFFLGLFLLPLLCFPGRVLPEINSVNLNVPLVLNVFGHLLWIIGPVFFALSTASVILQSWLANSDLVEKTNPYTLYAVSNLGSFVALISYPFLYGVFLDLDQQLWLWRVMYLLLLALIILAIFTVKVNSASKITKILSTDGILKQDCFRWFLFSAAGVMMFLSVTNIITYEVAPIPLLWVLPLCIYLVSFTLVFKQKPWAPRWLIDKFYLIFASSILIFFMSMMRILPFVLELIIMCFLLFSFCMFCQYNLSKSKPQNTANLPLFYLIISAGGFLGGLFTTWVMPLISVAISEYLLALAVIALALTIGTKRQNLGSPNMFLIVYICTMLMYWPVFFKYYNFFGLLIIYITFKICYSNLIKSPRAFLGSIIAVLCLVPFIDSRWANANYIYRHRNYYGVYKVYSEKGMNVLIHGTTIHGAQFKDKQKENLPFSYYHKLTPIGELLSSGGIYFKNIAVVGLGTGTLAAFASQEQEIDYFEIDPDMYFIAENLFTYIKNSKGKVNFNLGDARITLKNKKDKRYGLIVIDAFSGDSIPFHLLTTDAIEEYRKHLEAGGIVLFHVSNRYLDLIPVLFSNANYLNAYGCYQDNAAGNKSMYFASSWFALSWEIKSFNKLICEFKWIPYNPGKRKLIRPWTDKYSNEFSIIKLENFFDSIRNFKPFYW